ncbi:MAG TPA: zinc-ribbon domain-containing protein [Candidatus Nitrosotenuis sp.]|nr:zinc-ribbon domain-containing protein [Candidatus Nitrosotenuis sp.]
MSSELRLKKLRGSGGFVMAQVSDEQQRKGNLGGPDLFLAPVGRIEPERISKYYCNTCEKDYEGSPKIEYENPNEEVAQNLILLERGQYICTICGSTIAEYREFQKPNQQADVGLAKPLATEPVMTPTPPPPTPTFAAAMQMDPPTLSMPEASPTAESGSISSIVGMAVYDANAKKVGVAKQVGINSSNQVVLIITRNDGQDKAVEWNKIKKIGEIILLGEETSGAGATSSMICSKCHFENKPGSKFCESCGNKL